MHINIPNLVVPHLVGGDNLIFFDGNRIYTFGVKTRFLLPPIVSIEILKLDSSETNQ